MEENIKADTITVSNEAYFHVKKIKEHVLKLEEITSKRFSISPLISEYLAVKIYGLKLVKDGVNPGFDAYDDNYQKVHIKSRLYKGGKSAMVGVILSKHYRADFDYALLFLLNPDYSVNSVYKAYGKIVQNYFDELNDKRAKESKPRPKVKVMSIGNFIKLATKDEEFDRMKAIL